MMRIGGLTAGICGYREYTTTYIEIDQAAIPYKYLSEMRVKGCFNDLVMELLKLIKLSGKYFRRVELKDFGDR